MNPLANEPQGRVSPIVRDFETLGIPADVTMDILLRRGVFKALAMRRAVWDEIGPLDERYRLYAQDLDLCSRAADAGWRIRIVSRFRVVHHQGATVARMVASWSLARRSSSLAATRSV